MKFTIWIHGQPGNTHEIEARDAWDAITRFVQLRPTPFAAYRGEYVELCARRADGTGYMREETVQLP